MRQSLPAEPVCAQASLALAEGAPRGHNARRNNNPSGLPNGPANLMGSSMPRIVRCPSCFTYVYDNARNCHGCGGKLRNRRILTRASWVFIALSVTTFTVIRGVVLAQERRARVVREMEENQTRDAMEAFVNAWLRGSTEAYERHSVRREKFRQDLAKLHGRFCEVFPVDQVEDLKITSTGTRQHVRNGMSPAVMHGWNTARDANGANQPAAVAIAGSPANSARSMIGRSPASTTTWTCDAGAFYATCLREGREFEVWGTVCMDDSHEVTCLQIDRVHCTTDGTVIAARSE